MDPARFEFHHEEKVERHEPSLGLDFNGGEVDGCQHVPMRLDKGLPRGLLFPLGRAIDAVLP